MLLNQHDNSTETKGVALVVPQKGVRRVGRSSSNRGNAFVFWQHGGTRMASQLMSLKDDIIAAHEQCCNAGRNAIEYALQCGELLTALKPLIKENPATPPFGDWLDQNMPFSHRSANSYMKLYKDFGHLSNSQRFAILKTATSVDGVKKMLPSPKKKASGSSETSSGKKEGSESPEGDNGSESGSQEPRRGKSRLKTSAATLIDTLTKKHVGQIARGLTQIAEANGGEGAQFNAADAGLNQLIAALQEMRKGKK